MGYSACPRYRHPIDFPLTDFDRARESVMKAARELVDDTLTAYPDWSPPPFEPEMYAEALEIPITSMERATSNWDAILIPIGDQTRIVYNSGVASQARRHFSIAHEIVHTFFRQATGTHQARTEHRVNSQCPESRRNLERLCDLGAAELLMPQPWFNQAVDRHGFRASAIAGIAEEFAVSLEAAAIRMVETRPEPCAAGFFHLAAQPSLENPRPDKPRPKLERVVTYRVRRVFRSRGFPFLFPEGKSVPEESLVYRASLQKNELQGIETFHLGKTSRKLEVTAFPLHWSNQVSSPPTVCAVFRLPPVR